MIEGLPHQGRDWSIPFDDRDLLASVSASLVEQGFAVRREPRTVPGLVVSAR